MLPKLNKKAEIKVIPPIIFIGVTIVNAPKNTLLIAGSKDCGTSATVAKSPINGFTKIATAPSNPNSNIKIFIASLSRKLRKFTTTYQIKSSSIRFD